MARDDDYLAILSKVPLFSECNKRELRTIAQLGTPIQVPTGEILSKEGQPGHEFFVIESGRARVSLKGRKLGDLDAGDFFGEMALLDQGPRAATVTALSDMRVRVFGSREFSTLISDSPHVGKKILRGLASRLRAASGRRISPHE